MNLPEIKSYEEEAVDTVVSVINRAKELLGIRQTLKELAKSRDFLSPRAKIGSSTLKCPLIKNSEMLIMNAIEKNWLLTETLLYTLNYKGKSQDETSKYYYFEAVFSQPTAAYPIPQETASVFFRVEDKLIEPHQTRPTPLMTFRIEGHYRDHDVRFIRLSPDWILGVLKMKAKLFSRVEEIGLF
ncbi:uncharacterized protein LOC126972121 [Leptidea sinapis]|uniref:uncharacterized protein LOC126972121 n=1 Tax=Leptidea sinapis TaxID=189913 RepID=UPI002143D6A8|nr:uncharacterized protein LOC126972121 [Leptidea sinapis]